MKSLFFFLSLSLIVNVCGSCKKSEDKSNNEILRCRDIDGNVYDTLGFCSTIWISDNLRVSHYRNGDLIPKVENYFDWENLTTGAWCWYNNDSTSFSQYGKLYNWYAVNDSRGLAPAGWHIPSNDEWLSLANCLGGELVAGGRIKTRGTIESSTGLWRALNVTVDPYTGFNAIPGGYRDYNGSFSALGFNNYWWTSSVAPVVGFARKRYLVNNSSNLNPGTSGNMFGHYVRCVKD